MTDAEIVEFAREFRDGVLGGGSSRLMCFAICAPLETLLGLSGVECELVEADFGYINHVWLKLPNGDILDPTADQFGFEPVYLGPLPWQYERLMANKSKPVQTAYVAAEERP
jgi:hypothetical protein